MKTKSFNFPSLILIGLLFLTVSFTTYEFELAKKKKKIVEYNEAPYKKLCSESFADDYNNKGVIFKFMFLDEFKLINLYKMGKINTDNMVFINHRDISYVSSETGLGSSDLAMPDFPLAIDKSRSDFIFDSKKGDIFEVKGVAQKVALHGKFGLYIIIDENTKVE